MGKTLFKNARAIITCNDDEAVLYGHDLLVEGKEIRAIGKGLSPEGATVIDASRHFIYPGLINTHHHFFQAFVRNLTTIDRPNLPIVDWLREIYQVFVHIDEEAVYYASLICMAELAKHGCTTALDHQYCYTPTAGGHTVDRQMDAAGQFGIRFCAARGTNTRPEAEGSTIPAGMLETTEGYLADCERLIARYHDGGRLATRRIVLAPCQPINCRPETFTETLRLAREKGVYMHTHLGEGENNVMLSRFGKRSLAWCEEIGFLGPDVLIAHGRETLPEEYTLLAATSTGISHCPAPVMIGGSEVLDIRAMRAAGIPLSLACDGCATNDGSNLLDSMRLAYLLQTFHSKQRGGCVRPYEILRMATRGGAAMLGMDSWAGMLQAGSAADLFLIDTGRLGLAGAPHDPASLLPRVGYTDPVALTMVDGRIVWQDGAFPGIDEEALAAKAEEVCTRVLRDKCEVFAPFRRPPA